MKLGEVVSIKHGWAFPGSGITKKPNNNLLVTPGNFRIGGGFKDGRQKFYEGIFPKEYTLRPGDLVVTMTDLSRDMDTLGYPALIPSREGNGAKYLHNQRIGLVEILSQSSIHKLWLFYRLCCEDYRTHVLASATGTTVHHTSPSRILDFSLQVPSIETQIAIAATLGALDDKIELNQQVARKLNQLADLLAEQILLSGSTVEKSLSQLSYFNMKNLRKGQFNTIEYVDIKGTGHGFVESTALYDEMEAPSRARRLLKDGDVIYSTVRPNRQVFASIFDPVENLVASTGFAVATPIAPCGTSFLTFVFGTSRFAEYLGASAGGSAYPAVDVSTIGNYEVGVPQDISQLQEYEKSTISMRKHAHRLREENCLLASLRDTLLPELMSGRMRVAEAREAINAEVGS